MVLEIHLLIIEVILMFRGNLVDLPTKISLNYYWCSGFMIRRFLIVQVISGIILSFCYVSYSSQCFSVTINLILDDFYTWIVRYVHIWGVTFIFLLFFIHMGRALYYSSYRKLGVWKVGFILYILMMVEAFLGYVLPWHQMSYWAATVLSSIIKSIPFVGCELYKFVVGHYYISGAAISRVYSAHVCLAFVILGLSVVHLFYLHLGGSKKPLYVANGYSDVVAFHSYYTVKDAYLLVIMLLVFLVMLLVSPNCILDVERFIEANRMVTPVSIKPEWYFLAFYAMLRSIESKIGGLIFVLVFLFVLWLPTVNVSCPYCVVRQYLFWFIVSFFIVLRYLGACHPEFPYAGIRKVVGLALILFVSLFKVLWAVPSLESGNMHVVSE